MTEYIEREAALKICENEYRYRLRIMDYCGDTVAWNIASEIEAIPPASVEAVKHGHWIEYPREHCFRCSQCMETVPYRKAVLVSGERKYKYCPHCGAKMDLETDNE